MTLFWILAAALIALALVFVLPPLFAKRRPIEDVDADELNLAVFRQQLDELDKDLAGGELEQQQYDGARRDLERELLYDVAASDVAVSAAEAGGGRWAALVLGAAVPVVAVSLYLYLGDSAIIPRLQSAASGQTATADAAQGGELPPLQVMVQRLAEKLEQNPDNLQGWMMLGRTYFAIGEPGRALHALEQAYALAPANPDVLVAYAEAVAANQGGRLARRPAELIAAALEIEPRHASARWLAGLGSFQDAQYALAAEQWEALLPDFDPNSEEAAELKGYIAEARKRAGLSAEQSTDEDGAARPSGQGSVAAATRPTTVGTKGGTASFPGIRVQVSLADALRSRADADDSLFVYAKAAAGPPMPLAAHRARVADLPLTITLDDTMSMVPEMKLSGFDEVTVGARISKSGQAIPQSGDLEGEATRVKPGQSGAVRILIDRARP